VLDAHSWVECTKYSGDLANFDRSKCDSKGLPRPLSDGRNVGSQFGQDIGFDYRPRNSNNYPCQGNPRNFGQNYPDGVVEYNAGETYTLAWPAKNHVAAPCTNQHIPDTFLKLYMTPFVQNQDDPSQNTFRQKQVPASFSDVPHKEKTIDYEGFQKCPDFCGNAGTDRATCTGTFTIPADTTPGIYTLQWYWAMNNVDDLYATCWEARVSSQVQTVDPNDQGDDPADDEQPQETSVNPGTAGSDCTSGSSLVVTFSTFVLLLFVTL